MQILGILGIYFDAVEVFVTNFSLLFRLSRPLMLWWSLAWFPYFYSDCPWPCWFIYSQTQNQVMIEWWPLTNTILVTVGLLQVNLVRSSYFCTHNMMTDCSLDYNFNTWNFQVQTRGEHVAYRNSFWHSEQFLHSTYSPNVLQEEELLTKITCTTTVKKIKNFIILV